MRTILTFCVVGGLALMCTSCACKRCHGFGTEVAMTSGVHPYTKTAYKANETIPCLKCGGTGNSGNHPEASAFSGARAFDATLNKVNATGPSTIHVHEHYNQNTYVRPAYY